MRTLVAAGCLLGLWHAWGCAAPSAKAAQSAAQKARAKLAAVSAQAIDALEGLADLTIGPMIEDEHNSEAVDGRDGAGFSDQALRVSDLGDIAGSLDTFPFPSLDVSTASFKLASQVGGRPAWLKSNPHSYDYSRFTNRRFWFVGAGAQTSASGPPFAREDIMSSKAKGAVVEDVISGLEATASTAASASPPLPEIFAAAVPANALIRTATLNWRVFDTTDTAAGYRWAIHDASKEEPFPLVAWIRAYQIRRASPSATIDSYDAMEVYQRNSEAPARNPMRRILDCKNLAEGTSWHEIRNLLYPQWRAQGTFVDAASVSYKTSADRDVLADTTVRTLEFTSRLKWPVRAVLGYAPDQAGSGTVWVFDDTEACKLAWTSTLVGTATCGKVVRTFRVPKP